MMHCLIFSICPSISTTFITTLPTLEGCRHILLLVQTVSYISISLSYNKGILFSSVCRKVSEKALEMVLWVTKVVIISHAKRYVRRSWRNVAAVWLGPCSKVWVQAAGAPGALCPCAEVDACIPGWAAVMGRQLSFLALPNWAFSLFCSFISPLLANTIKKTGSSLYHWKLVKMLEELQSTVKFSPSWILRNWGLCSSCWVLSPVQKQRRHQERELRPCLNLKWFFLPPSTLLPPPLSPFLLPSLILPFKLYHKITCPAGFSFSSGFPVHVIGSFSNSHANWIQRSNTKNFRSIFSSEYHVVTLVTDCSCPLKIPSWKRLFWARVTLATHFDLSKMAETSGWQPIESFTLHPPLPPIPNSVLTLGSILPFEILPSSEGIEKWFIFNNAYVSPNFLWYVQVLRSSRV